MNCEWFYSHGKWYYGYFAQPNQFTNCKPAPIWRLWYYGEITWETISGLIALFCIIGFVAFVAYLMSPRLRRWVHGIKHQEELAPAPAPEPQYEYQPDPPIESNIDLEWFVRDKLEPAVAPEGLPKVRKTVLTFDQEKTEDGIVVRAYLLLSPEDVAIIESKGLEDEVLENEPAYDPERLSLLRAAQEEEIARAPDARVRAGLRALHKQQLEDAKEWKLERTIADYRAMERHFKRQLEATKWQKELEQRVMRRINTLLDHFRDEATQPIR
jgi:hypothetical protein